MVCALASSPGMLRMVASRQATREARNLAAPLRSACISSAKSLARPALAGLARADVQRNQFALRAARAKGRARRARAAASTDMLSLPRRTLDAEQRCASRNVFSTSCTGARLRGAAPGPPAFRRSA